MAKCFVGGSSIRSVDGAKLELTDKLYRWTYGQYQIQHIALSEGLVSHIKEVDAGQTGISYYDVTLDGNGYLTITYKGYCTIDNPAVAQGYYVYSGNAPDGNIAIWRVQSMGTIWRGGSTYLYYTTQGYYPYLPSGWTKREGYILERDIDAYPNNAYINGVYYGERKLLS